MPLKLHWFFGFLGTVNFFSVPLGTSLAIRPTRARRVGDLFADFKKALIFVRRGDYVQI